MRFNPNTNFNYNLTNLPILEFNNEYFCPEDMCVMESIDHKNYYLRFNDVYRLARYNNYSITEAVNDIIDCHREIDTVPILLVNEYTYYIDDEYKQSVLENIEDIPMQFESIDVPRIFGNILNECIEADIYNNTTYNTDYVLLEFLDAINKAFTNVSKNITSGMDTAASKAGQLSDDVSNSVATGAQKYLNKGLDFVQQHAPGIAEKFGGTFGKNMVDSAIGSARDVIGKQVNSNTVKAAGAAGLGAAILGIRKLLGNADSAQDGPIAGLKSIVNQVKGKIQQVTGMQKSAPAEQQGILSQLLEKLKKALSSLMSKISSSSNGAQPQQ